MLKKINFSWWSALLLGALCIVFYLRARFLESKISENVRIVSALIDTVKNQRLNDRSLLSTIESFSVLSQKSLLEIRSKDSLINRLQKIISSNKNVETGVAIDNTTGVSDSGKTVVHHRDTVYVDEKVYMYPAYSYYKKDDWIEINVLSTKDTTFVDLLIENKYDVYITRNRGKYSATVHSLSPYTKDQKVRAMNVIAPSPKRLGLGINAGYGMTKEGLSPYVGIGIQYNIIEF